MSETENAVVERKVDREIADTIAMGKGGINFSNAGEVMEYAKMMAASQSAVPKHLRGQPGACLGVLDDAIRFRINPYALARKSYFVNDMLAYEAQVFSAIVNAWAPLKVRPDMQFEGEGQERRCVVIGTFRDGAVREYRSPRLADISPKNSPLWKTDPDQQLSYYSLRAFARRWCPEVILGIYDAEEIREAAMTDITPEPPSKPAPRSLDEFAAAAETGHMLQQAAGDRPDDAGATGSGEAPPSPQPPSAAATDLFEKSIAIEAILGLAHNDGDEDDRLADINRQWPIYQKKFEKTAPEFLGRLFSTAERVARGEQRIEDAKKELEKP